VKIVRLNRRLKMGGLMKRNKGQTYQLTPKGVISIHLLDEEMVTRILDALELQALRQNCNALTFVNGEGQFVKIYEKA
jgi:hypothetical protein